MSATSVFKDDRVGKGQYYVTYHMQGNNYNTTLDKDVAGAIQVYSLSDGENGSKVLTLGNVFTSENRNNEDYDFNHIYFDRTDNRILVVGHKWTAHNDGTPDPDHLNTVAIIGNFDPEATEEPLKYTKINTSEKAYDENGKSLGYKDAGDANSVMRAGEMMNPNHTYGWDFYFVATRKGMAVLRAEADHLFEPVLTEDGINYFIPTPGSAKSVARTGTSSFFDLLYLSDNISLKGDNNKYETESHAKIAHFSTQTGTGTGFGFLKERSTNQIFNPWEKDILQHGDQTDLPSVITPIDGKNTLLCAPDTYNDNERYVAMGKSGMYYHFHGVNSGKETEGVLKFKGSNGYLPVNCVTADVSDLETGHDGFMYVACGARLVILHRKTFELVAYWNIPTKDANGYLDNVAASANYIHVEKGPVVTDSETNRKTRERIITVAFGQEGLKVFRFNPATLESKTVWENKELPTEIVCN